MSRNNDFLWRVVAAVVVAICFFALTVYVGVEIGIQEEYRNIMVVGGLFATFLFAIFVWKTFLSLVGILPFLTVLWAGDFANLAPGETLTIAVISCVITAFFVMSAKEFRK